MGDDPPKPQRVRRQRSLYQVHYSLPPPADMPRPLVPPGDSPPRDLSAFDNQVAGHSDSTDTKYLGLLRYGSGKILKPIIKEAQRREVEFYNRITTSEDSELVNLRKLTPKYYGCEKFTYNGFEQEYIILEDLTLRMLQPCIMDIKIGRRTWDPLATEEKINNEKAKYSKCKQEYGFCIPGYQVYRLSTGKLHRYNKEHGKKLHGQMVKDAIRSYLNGGECGGGLCRALLVQLVSELWRVQCWARGQCGLRLYSASVLLVYDAARLRACCAPSADDKVGAASVSRQQSSSPPPPPPLPPPGRRSPLPPELSATYAISPTQPAPSAWAQALDKLHHSHSFEHNYENKLEKIKMNYRAVLDQLCHESPTPSPWGTVKVIDFAHAFFSTEEERTPDLNFLDGIDSLVRVFESFLRETDDQIF